MDEAQTGQVMSNFDFITNEPFRNSLESDYRELNECIEAGSWKAAHVLAGSIVEALLVDYLISTDFSSRSKEDPLKFDLGKVIATCRAENIISQRVEDLSSVIREYRNLIHPGRSVRLGEGVDCDSALIAKSLVALIAKEVTAKRKIAYGLTAQQIVSKVISDPSNTVVMSRLLNTANQREISRLLLDTIPAAYRQREDPWLDEAVVPALKNCFRLAFDRADITTKQAVACEFVRVLENEAEGVIQSYEDGLFVFSELHYLPPDNARLVKAHFLAKLKRRCTERQLRSLVGIEKFIIASEVGELLDPLLTTIAYGSSEDLMALVAEYLRLAFLETPCENDNTWTNRLEAWVKHLNDQGRHEKAAIVANLKSQAEAESVPF